MCWGKGDPGSPLYRCVQAGMAAKHDAWGGQLKEADFSSGAPGMEKPVFPKEFCPPGLWTLPPSCYPGASFGTSQSGMSHSRAHP